MPLITRLTSTGNLQANVEFIESTPSGVAAQVTPTSVVARSFDEVTISGNVSPLPVKKETSAGELQVAGIFDEVTISNVASYGGHLWSTPGSYTWTCPAGVTSISIVCIGAGGAGSTTSAIMGGVTGGFSAFKTSANGASIIFANGGSDTSQTVGGGGLDYTATFKGGSGGGGNSSGGGGAAGYSGDGGAGGWSGTGGGSPNGVSGTGGAGGGGYLSSSGYPGGGVGVYGEGASGLGGGVGATLYGGPGSGGQAFNTALALNFSIYSNYGGGGWAPDSTWYGGGGGGLAYKNNYTVTPGTTYYIDVGRGGDWHTSTNYSFGGDGAVRIIWPGNVRTFPSTGTGYINWEDTN